MLRIALCAGLVLALALPHPGCSRSSGGSDKAFAVLSASVGGADLLPLNGEIRLTFSEEIARDPAPAIFIFESESNGTRMALGELVLRGKTATFTPRLPTLPDLSDAALRRTLDVWLAPLLASATGRADLDRLDLTRILRSLLPYEVAGDLDRLAPESLPVPTGRRARLVTRR